MTFKLDAAERATLSAEVDDKLLEGLIAMERFVRRLFDQLGIHYEELEPGVLKVPADKKHGDLLRKQHLLVFDPSIYPSVEAQNAELLTPASPFFRNLLAKAEGIGPLSIIATRRATPYTMFHFHVHLKGMNFEWEEILTIGVDDDGDSVQNPPQLRELLEELDPIPKPEPTGTDTGDTAPPAPDATHETNQDSTRQDATPGIRQNAGHSASQDGIHDPSDTPASPPAAKTPSKFTVRERDQVPESKRKVPQVALEQAPQLVKQQIAPKLDELAAAVETGLRKTQERLAAYYEQMRDETRREDVRLRRRIGEINAKIFYTEDRIRLLRLEKERDLLAEELDKVKKKSRRALEHLELEEHERLSKEAERARPTVKIRLVAATRVLAE